MSFWDCYAFVTSCQLIGKMLEMLEMLELGTDLALKCNLVDLPIVGDEGSDWGR